jgi:hypothetical protein
MSDRTNSSPDEDPQSRFRRLILPAEAEENGSTGDGGSLPGPVNEPQQTSESPSDESETLQLNTGDSEMEAGDPVELPEPEPTPLKFVSLSSQLALDQNLEEEDKSGVEQEPGRSLDEFPTIPPPPPPPSPSKPAQISLEDTQPSGIRATRFRTSTPPHRPSYSGNRPYPPSAARG